MYYLDVLVHLDCYKLGGLQLKHVFITVLEAGKSKMMALADWVSNKACFIDGHLFVTLYGRMARELSGASLMRALIPFMGPLDLMTWSPLKESVFYAHTGH